MEKKEKRVVFAGAFDPWTYAHCDLLHRAKKMFHRVIIAVCSHPRHKPSYLCLERRIAIIQDSCKELQEVEIKPFTGLITDFCRREGVFTVIRGLRNAQDFQYEWEMYQHNKVLEPEIEWVLLPCDKAYTGLSSSRVKEIHALGGDVSHWVSALAQEAMQSKDEKWH